jgi:hypothetical protein
MTLFPTTEVAMLKITHTPTVSKQTKLVRPSGQAGQTGFIQGVLLFGIALLAIVIAAFSFSNKSSTNSTAAEEAKTYASTIASHGNSIKAAADRFRTDRGELTRLNMDFNTTAATGLFNAVDNFITSGSLVAQAQAFTTAPDAATVTITKNGHFYLKRSGTIAIGGINMLMIATTGPLTDATCRRINTNLHRTNIIPVATAGAVVDFQGTGTGNVTITVGAGATEFPVTAVNLEEGCVRTTGAGGANFYFKVLQRI